MKKNHKSKESIERLLVCPNLINFAIKNKIYFLDFEFF